MTKSITTSQPATTVTLNRRQVEQIMHDMGWESDDADVFWDLACRETRDPYCLEHENRRYLQAILRSTAGGQP